MTDPWVQEIVSDSNNDVWFKQQRREALELMEEAEHNARHWRGVILKHAPPEGVKMELEVWIQFWLNEKDLQHTVYRRFDNYIKRHSQGTKIDLDRLKKEVPLTSVLAGKGIKTGGRIKFICPLHKEDSPSFVWYEKTHSYWCFGCNKGGSIIDLYMAINNVTVGDAIKELSKLV